MGICRFPKCSREDALRQGLCGKHYHWLRKGYMTNACIVLKAVKEQKYKDGQVLCSVPTCDRIPRRNGRCVKHDSQFRAGVIDENNKRIEGLRAAPGAYTECKVCKTRNGPFSKGFCKSHHSAYRRGRIDINGLELRERKKRLYKPGQRCKAKDCPDKPRGRGFCERHLSQLMRGDIDERGIPQRPLKWYNKNRTCRALKCSRPAHCLGYCLLHYHRQQHGYLNIEDSALYKRYGKGGFCRTEGCSQPTLFDGLCKTHYEVLLNMRVHVARKPADQIVPGVCPNIGCTTSISMKSRTGLCRRCNTRKRWHFNKLKREPVREGKILVPPQVLPPPQKVLLPPDDYDIQD